VRVDHELRRQQERLIWEQAKATHPQTHRPSEEDKKEEEEHDPRMGGNSLVGEPQGVRVDWVREQAIATHR
jgi:hypothetical protein